MKCGIAIYAVDDLKLLGSFRNFSMVEVSGEMLDEDNFEEQLPLEYTVCVRELLGRSIVSGLPEVPFQVCRELLKLMDKRCELMNRCGITLATLTPDIGHAAADKSYAAALNDILLSIAGICGKHDIELRFELRLPENFEQALDLTGKFLRSSTLFRKLRLDFHPHEPGSFDFLTAVTEKFPFNRDSWRISFEVASCNYLSPEVVKRVMKASRPGGWDEDHVIFAPGVGTGAENYALLDKVAGECFSGGVDK